MTLYRRRIMFLLVPALLLQAGGAWLGLIPGNEDMGSQVLGWGAFLSMPALAYWAKSKGRSPWWGLVGIASVIGVIIVRLLKDSTRDSRELPPITSTESDVDAKAKDICVQCGVPLIPQAKFCGSCGLAIRDIGS